MMFGRFDWAVAESANNRINTNKNKLLLTFDGMIYSLEKSGLRIEKKMNIVILVNI